MLSSRNHNHNDKNLPLLVRFARQNYRGRPEVVDLEYLDDLIKGSLDEALADLRVLRQDHELWLTRLAETSAKSPGTSSIYFLKQIPYMYYFFFK